MTSLQEIEGLQAELTDYVQFGWKWNNVLVNMDYELSVEKVTRSYIKH